MKNLRKKFELFCFKNRDKGIPNLMLYIVIGTAVVYLFSQMSGNALLYSTLRFDRTSILQGQVWRLITYPLTYSAGNILLTAITLLCYYSLGRAMENVWGTLRFNLFYLTGVVMMDVYCLTFGGQASVTYLNLSLFLSYATLYPDANFLLFFIIPVKAWIFALIDLAMVLLSLFTDPFPYNLFPVIAQLFSLFRQGRAERDSHVLARQRQPPVPQEAQTAQGKGHSFQRRLLRSLHRHAESPLHPPLHDLRTHRCDKSGAGIPLLLQVQGLLLLLSGSYQQSHAYSVKTQKSGRIGPILVF